MENLIKAENKINNLGYKERERGHHHVHKIGQEKCTTGKDHIFMKPQHKHRLKDKCRTLNNII